ncbi:MAG TPA: response regulator transcription factor [Cytophagaceae bacterium]
MKTIKVVIADDHQIVVDGLVAMIKEAEDIQVRGTANNGIQLLNLLKENTVDVAIVDIEMPEMSGIDVTRKIMEENINTKVLILSMYNETSLIKQLRIVGAKGYILKTINKNNLLEAIRTIAEGNFYFTSEILTTYNTQLNGYLQREDIPDINVLTNREKEILLLLSEGLTIPEISDKLCISHKTTETHKSNMMKKLKVNSSSKLIRIAYKSGLCK